MAAMDPVLQWVIGRPQEMAALLAFSDAMAGELAANSGKGDRPGWLGQDVRELLSEIQHHYAKLHTVAVELDRAGDEEPRSTPWGDDLPALVREFAADVANQAMMLADRCGVLGVPADV